MKTAILWNVFSYRHLRSQKTISSLHNAGHNTFYAPIGCFLWFVMLNTTRKNRPKIFFTGEIASFEEFVFSTNYWVLKNFTYKFHSICQHYFGTLTNHPRRFVTLEIKRESMLKSFLHWKDCFFSKTCVFKQPLRCHGKDPITSTVTVKLPVRPLQIVPWGLSHSKLREKWGQILLSLER